MASNDITIMPSFLKISQFVQKLKGRKEYMRTHTLIHTHILTCTHTHRQRTWRSHKHTLLRKGSRLIIQNPTNGLGLSVDGNKANFLNVVYVKYYLVSTQCPA
jgi:hypothetical protein